MSNLIWKMPDVKPEENKQIIFYAGGGHFAYMGWYYKKADMFGAWDASETQKWIYYDDLIAQADKAERLQKAVDYALQVLDNVSEIGGIDLEMIKIEQLIKGE